VTTIGIAIPSLSESDHRAHPRRAVIASTVGTTIDWYDFPALPHGDRPRLRQALLS
jgi:hypothetical protein